ncbi:hypothetical protein [Massilia sp. DWR3-1-1]|uniref:hypothetical protein n=1 Tax=Massilia sp. DWR3-1-1 TaxID=2804559 RepID=UPI003CEE4E21
MNAINIQGRPQRPLIGPQAPYSLTGHNIGMGTRDPIIRFEDGDLAYQMDLEWALYSLELFDEPSRHAILAGTAVHFGMPFEVVMGGLL